MIRRWLTALSAWLARVTAPKPPPTTDDYWYR